MYRGKLSTYLFLISAVLVGVFILRCVEVPTETPPLPEHLKDNQVRFVNGLSFLSTELSELDPTILQPAPSDTTVLQISLIDTTFTISYDTVAAADTAAQAGTKIDSIRHDSIEIEIVDGAPDTTLDSTWYDFIFSTDTTITAIDSTIDTTNYVLSGMKILERTFREDSALVSAIDLMVDEGGTSVNAVPFMGASGYLDGWPVGQHTVHLQALSDENTYREITKLDTVTYTLTVKDTADFYGNPGADGFANLVQSDSIINSVVIDTTVNITSGDTVSDSLAMSFQSDRKATILLHNPNSSGEQVTSYTDNYLSSGPVDVEEEAEFALLRVINAASAGIAADVSIITNSDTTGLATGDDALGFTRSTGYKKYEDVGAKTLYVTSQASVFDPAAEEYVDMAVEISEDITLEVNKRYTAFLFQDGTEFFIEVMVDDE